MKKCNKCCVEKNTSEFGSDKSTRDGISRHCKKCRNEYARKRKRKTALFKCESCGVEKEIDFYKHQERKTNYCLNCCSIETQKGIKRPDKCGNNHARWNGGEYISTDGYKMLKCENEFHPSGRQKYKRAHVVVMEEHIGRELKTERGNNGEQVHHIDGNKLNNNIENLVLCSNTSEHRMIEHQLTSIAFDLVRSGDIIFDHKTKQYKLKKDQ